MTSATIDYSIQQITFSSGDQVELTHDSILVVVGPNNAGKSACLREIRQLLRDDKSRPTDVVSRVDLSQKGTSDDVRDWMSTNMIESGKGALQNRFTGVGTIISAEEVSGMWNRGGAFKKLTDLLFGYADTERRLQASNPVDSLDLNSQVPTHPLQYLLVDEKVEPRLSQYFQEAFGVPLTLCRVGQQIELFVGSPKAEFGPDRASPQFIGALLQLPRLREQGDGMRSFVGTLLHAAVERHRTITALDEPEAFLHPPQARLLGRILASETDTTRQLVIATHSGDLLRGLLTRESQRLQVVRLTRTRDVNSANLLSSEQIVEFWSDPLLRHSQALDALFHATAVICESDTDCRFYSAILDAIVDSGAMPRRPDVIFVSAGGKQRIQVVAKALHNAGVDTHAIADFDLLREKNDTLRLFEALGGEREKVQDSLKSLQESVAAKSPALKMNQVREQIFDVLNCKEDRLTSTVSDAIKQALKQGSPWGLAKEHGLGAVGSGERRRAGEALLQTLAKAGVHVVPVGELECWDKSQDSHGTRWVSAVLEKDLARDPALLGAREFVAGIFES